MPAAPVDIEAVGASSPEPVVREAGHRAHGGPVPPERYEADVPAVGVAGEDEIGFAGGQVTEGTGVVEHHEPEGAVDATDAAKDGGVGLPPVPAVLEADDVNGPGRGGHGDGGVDEQADAGGLQRGAHLPEVLVVMISETGERPAGQRPEGREGTPEGVRRARALHREEVAGEQDEVGRRGHRARTEAREGPSERKAPR